MRDFEPTIGLHPDLPNEDYHALTGWWSSSQLKRQLPERYKTSESQAALDFGTLAHTVVLEPDQLDAYVPLDAVKIGVKSDGSPAANPLMTAAWGRACAEVAKDGKIPVAQTDWDAAHAMRDAIAAHPTAAALLLSPGGVSEESAFAVDAGGVAHKARFDRRIPGAIVDLKTTAAKPGADSLARTIIDYGYDLSAAHYLAVAGLLELDVDGFGFVFVHKSDPLRVTVVELDEVFMARGRALRALALKRATDPTEPAYEGASGYLTLQCPRWAEMEEEL